MPLRKGRKGLERWRGKGEAKGRGGKRINQKEDQTDYVPIQSLDQKKDIEK